LSFLSTFREKYLLKKIDKRKLPRHVAIIMDGNGRWAKKRHLPRIAGHRAGVKSIRPIVEASSELDIKYLTLYAFSVENWKRPKEEINGLMSLFEEMIRKEGERLHKENVRLNAIGRIDELPDKVKRLLKEYMDLTRENSKLVLTLALNYGGRAEIIDAVNKAIKEEEKPLEEKDFFKFLYDSELPDPDLLIRTSGEMRVSNFLLWQIAYTEFWITPVFWPDFKKYHFYQAIIDYQRRKRRFGGIGEDL
jgi:undecaprenyl diphosphate synthase